MSYVDGFVLAVPKANLETYKDMARLAGSVWVEHAPCRRRTTRWWCFPG